MELDESGFFGEKQDGESSMPMHRVHDILIEDGSEDMPSSAGPSLLRGHDSQPLQDDVLPPPNTLRRHSSKPICENGQLRRRFSHLHSSAFTHKIKPRSSYDINSRKCDVEHDELPTLSETERLLRDSFQRDTRVAILSEQALESIEPTLTSSTEKLPRIQCMTMGQRTAMMKPNEVEIPGTQQEEGSSVYDIVHRDGDEDTSSSAGPSLLRRHNSPFLERQSLDPVPLRRYRSEPICDSSGRAIKPRSCYDTRKGAVEHDERPTLSEQERLLRDAFRREGRTALLSELASGSTEPSLAESSPRRRKILMSSIDCPGVPTEVHVETLKPRSVYNQVQGSRIDLVATTLAYLATQ
jgi:hypothetical protein